MKTKIILTLFTSIFSATIFNASFAQQTMEIVAVHKPLSAASVASIEKATNYICTAESMDITSLKPVKNVPVKVLRAFYKLFDSTGVPEWYAYGNKERTFLAEFNINGRQSRALYGKGGYLFYAVSDATEKDLPSEYRTYIKANYVDYDLTFLSEVTSSDYKTSWFVNLRDTKNQVIVKLTEDGLDELARFEIQGDPASKKAVKNKDRKAVTKR